MTPPTNIPPTTRSSTQLRTYEGRPLANPDEDIYDQGLTFDLQTNLDRRRVLKLLGFTTLSAGLVALVGCAPGSTASGSAASSAIPGTGSSASAADASCDVIPEETAGPFPGDGSNGPDVLGQSGVVRSDIRSSFGDLSGTAEGIPLTIRIELQDPRKAARRSRTRLFTSGTATARVGTRSIRRASPTATTYAASRRPAATGS